MIVSVRIVAVVVVVPGGRRERSVVGVLVVVGRDLDGGTHVRSGERRAVPGAGEMGDDQHDEAEQQADPARTPGGSRLDPQSDHLHSVFD